jgi:hypothetical protein
VRGAHGGDSIYRRPETGGAAAPGLHVHVTDERPSGQSDWIRSVTSPALPLVVINKRRPQAVASLKPVLAADYAAVSLHPRPAPCRCGSQSAANHLITHAVGAARKQRPTSPGLRSWLQFFTVEFSFRAAFRTRRTCAEGSVRPSSPASPSPCGPAPSRAACGWPGSPSA